MISLSAEAQALIQVILSGAPCPPGVFGSGAPSSDLDLVFLTESPMPIETLAEYRDLIYPLGWTALTTPAAERDLKRSSIKRCRYLTACRVFHPVPYKV